MSLIERLLTAAEVAEVLQISESEVKRRTRDDKWPCVPFSRKTIRYTQHDVAEIIRRRHQNGEDAPVVGLAGQTSRSKARAG